MDEFNKLPNDDEKKQFLGNYLYQCVIKKLGSNKDLKDDAKEELSGRITGMILEGQTVEYILYLCTDKEAFYQIVTEANQLIDEAEKSIKE